MEPWIKDYIWLMILLPIAGAAFNGLLGFRVSKRVVSLVGCGTVGAAFILALIAFFNLVGLEPEHRQLTDHLYTWLEVGNLKAQASLLLDPLSSVMILVITGVGFLIHVYSTGYMAHDKSYWRFFSFLNLFIFFMLLLVLGDNLFMLFIGWEGVGLCSYLLIGFWYTDKHNAACGMKAFIVNRVGDFGFIIGIFVLFWAMGGKGVWTFSFLELKVNAHLLDGVMLWGMGAVTVTTLFFTLGAVGKSAQIPLYIWLPDAMAGPTPVSALIHAATMVTAGIYMIGRLNFLYLMAPATMTVVAVAGTATALVAATIAVTQNDIKKVLAYSTISQLGYMFTAMGVAAFSAGIFHLLTHAFFKALLFLGAGSVIHGMSGKQDMTGMGGLRRLMPLTFWTFLAGTLAITGIPGLSGFFSKDEILWKAFSTSNRLLPHLPFFLWFIGFLVAGLTAFYMFRLLIKTFFGKCRADEGIREHIHESPYAMTVPLAIFAVFSVSAGYVGVPRLLGGLNRFHHFLAPVFGEGADGQVIQHASVSVTAAATVAAAGAGEAAQHGGYALEAALMALSVAMVAAGIFIADLMYRRHPHYPAKLAEKFRGFHRVLINKYYVDEFYHAVFTTSLLKLNRVLAWFDSHVIDGTIRGTAMSTRLLAKVSRAFDDKGVDGIVKGMAEGTISAGGQLRKIQTGRIQTYVYYVLGGIVIIVMVRLVVS